MIRNSLLLIIFLSLTSCNPYVNPITTVPALVLGAYDKANKRDKWLEYANKGDVYAQYELANSYCCSPTEGKKNFKQSLKWFCTAARNGHARAQLLLGKLYDGQEKLGELQFARDDARAYMWYSLAAKRSNFSAIDLKRQLKAKISARDLGDGKYLIEHYKKVPCDTAPLEWTEE